MEETVITIVRAVLGGTYGAWSSRQAQKDAGHAHGTMLGFMTLMGLAIVGILLSWLWPYLLVFGALAAVGYGLSGK